MKLNLNEVVATFGICLTIGLLQFLNSERPISGVVLMSCPLTGWYPHKINNAPLPRGKKVNIIYILSANKYDDTSSSDIRH